MNLSFFITFPRIYGTPCAQSAVLDRLVMLTVCSQQILIHMDESGIYNESDLNPFHRRLSELRYVHSPITNSWFQASAGVRFCREHVRDAYAQFQPLSCLGVPHA